MNRVPLPENVSRNRIRRIAFATSLLLLAALTSIARHSNVARHDTVLIFSVPFDRNHQRANREVFCDNGPPCYVRYDFPGGRNPRIEFFRVDARHYRYVEYSDDSFSNVGEERTTGLLRIFRQPLDSADGYVEHAFDGSQHPVRTYFIGLRKVGDWIEFSDSKSDDYQEGTYRNGNRAGVWKRSSRDGEQMSAERNYRFPNNDPRHFMGDILPLADSVTIRSNLIGRWADGWCGASNIDDLTGMQQFVRCSAQALKKYRNSDDTPVDCNLQHGSAAFIDLEKGRRFSIVYRGGCDRSYDSPTGGSWSVAGQRGAYRLELNISGGHQVGYELRRLIPGEAFEIYRNARKAEQ